VAVLASHQRNPVADECELQTPRTLALDGGRQRATPLV
jgi:hypothetical protein